MILFVLLIIALVWGLIQFSNSSQNLGIKKEFIDYNISSLIIFVLFVFSFLLGIYCTNFTFSKKQFSSKIISSIVGLFVSVFSFYIFFYVFGFIILLINMYFNIISDFFAQDMGIISFILAVFVAIIVGITGLILGVKSVK